MYKIIKRSYLRMLEIAFSYENDTNTLPFEIMLLLLTSLSWGLVVTSVVVFVIAWLNIGIYFLLRYLSRKRLAPAHSLAFRILRTLLLIPIKWICKNHGVSINELASISLGTIAVPRVVQIQGILSELSVKKPRSPFWFLYDSILSLRKEYTFLFPAGDNHSIIDRYQLFARYLPILNGIIDRPFEYCVYENSKNDPHGRFNGFIETLSVILYRKVKEIRIQAIDKIFVERYQSVPIDNYTASKIMALLEP